MMSRKQERKNELAIIRQHARSAARNGVPRHACPYEFSNKIQWLTAYDREVTAIESELSASRLEHQQRLAQEERRQQEASLDELRRQVEEAKDLEELKEVLLQLIDRLGH